MNEQLNPIAVKSISKSNTNLRAHKKAKSISRKENKTQTMSRFKLWACDYVSKVQSAFNFPNSSMMTRTPMARNRMQKRNTVKSFNSTIKLKQNSISFTDPVFMYRVRNTLIDRQQKVLRAPKLRCGNHS
eukprot:TRINITY_DN13661_c0_g1_i2.p1 TRINITY_DN13661_c0_g1~~TRINITY_DN13661_c0_g1_i2.p1  ORF type:complete len:130 (+),score=1.31 TRINITY_DN13661_c0_g1_i2:100-489(+)